jgi:hypothetical protein
MGYETFLETGHAYASSGGDRSQAAIVNYSLVLLCLLVGWIVYLLLPKGARCEPHLKLQPPLKSYLYFPPV